MVLPKTFGSKGFITAVKVTKIWRGSGESKKSGYIYPIWGIPGDIAIYKSLDLKTLQDMTKLPEREI